MAGNELLIDILGASATPPSESFPPFIINELPTNGALDVARSTNFSFLIDDVESGINQATINVSLSVDGGPIIDAIINGVFQVGFLGVGSQIVPGGSGGYTVTIDPETDLANFKQVDWTASGSDNAPVPNSVVANFTFRTIDDIPPFISNRVPTPGATDVSPATNITFRLNDLDTAVVKLLINVTIDEGSGPQPAITNGVFVAPYNGPGSSIVADGFDCIVIIDKVTSLTDEEIIELDVTFEDGAGNSVNVVYQFDTITPPPPGPPIIAPLLEEIFPLDIYRFIIFEIRRQDLQGSPRPGTEFLKRYLSGPNTIWQTNVAKIQSIPKLWNVTEIEDAFLKFLKWIVGWTDEVFLKKITDAISDDTLRRLIAASGRLWNTRGPEDAILNALNVIAGGARARIWNWFDFRWVLDESELGEEHEGRDPWIISLPSVVESEFTIDDGTKAVSSDGITVDLNFGTFGLDVDFGKLFRLTSGPENGKTASVLTRVNATRITLQGLGIGASFTESDWEVVDQDFVADDEYRSNLRIVDDGTLDRTLTLRVLKLMRSVGERWEITYLDFLDRFGVEGDDNQWEPLPSGNVPVSGGTMQLTDVGLDEETFAIGSFAAGWTEYVFSSRIRGRSNIASARFYCMFYYQDSANHYRVAIDTVSKELKIQSVVASVVTDLATLDLNAALIDLLPDVYYLLRVTVINLPPPSSDHRISVFVDGSELLFVETSKDFTDGTVGYRHDTSARIEIDETEVFQLPVDQDELTINQEP